MFISTSPPAPISTSPCPTAPPPSPTTSLHDLFAHHTSLLSSASRPICAFPSWPNRPSLAHSPDDEPSAFISDDDLFPPSVFEPINRSHHDAAAYSRARHAVGYEGMGRGGGKETERPLPPLYAVAGRREEEGRRRRRRSSRKMAGGAKAMTPIVEGLE